MKVLVVHNRYRSALPSGENNVVDTEVDLLRSAGVDVHTFIRSSDEIAVMPVHRRVGVALSPITGHASRESFREMLRRVRPDVVHLHNPYPLISPTVIDESRRAGAAVVATVNNFRLRCMNGYFFRDGEVCTACEDRRVQWPGIVHACYRESLAQSMVMAAALTRHRSSWSAVDRFLAVSPFVAERLQQWGVPPDRVVLKPNTTPDRPVAEGIGTGYLYAGRLSDEKGVLLLLDAWAASGLDATERLLIAGDGPLRSEVERRAAALQGVAVLGNRSPQEVAALRADTAVAVFPSTWFEAMSAAPESFAAGRPVIATSVGGLADVVDDAVGWSVSPTVEAMADALRASCDRDERVLRGAAARRRFDAGFAPQVLLDRQLAAYGAAVAARR